MFIRLLWGTVLSLTILLSQAEAQTYGTQRGTVEFTSSVPLHTFTGTSTHLTGEINLETNTVDFYVDLETLETGIGRRDRDMRETLETDEYPFAEFTGRLTTAFSRQANGPQRARVEGTFTVHGVSRALTVSGTLENVGSQIRMIANWELRLDDYNIEPPRLLVVRVDEVQAIHVNALLS
ncbi:MAG: YceI family protein, partial [Rubricoccaceae bacterium]|nr:YceI family protein [Rubricoccaceae bacterium]